MTFDKNSFFRPPLVEVIDTLQFDEVRQCLRAYSSLVFSKLPAQREAVSLKWAYMLGAIVFGFSMKAAETNLPALNSSMSRWRD